MPDAPADNPPTAAGAALDWSDAELDRLADVDEDDLDDAVAYWRANAPERYRELIVAGPAGDA